MHARNRTWLLGSDPVERCRQRTLPVEGGDGSTLSLDFTTGVLDPRLSFTRTTNATFINSQGLVQFADANLLQRSQDYTAAAWSKSRIDTTTSGLNTANTTTAPDGTSTGLLLKSDGVSGTHRVLQSNAITGSTALSTNGLSTVTLSAYFKANGSNFCSLKVSNNIESRGVTRNFNLTNGVVSGAEDVSWTFVSASASPVGNGWYRCQMTVSLTRVDANDDQMGIWLFVANGPDVADRSFTNSAASVWVWGAQVSIGANALEYRATTTAPYQAPRFDHDPTTLAPRGLLVEGTATNICLNGSMAYTATAPTSWTRAFSGCTVASVDSTTFPGQKAWSISATAIGQRDFLEQVIALAANTTYTVSAYVEAITGTVATFAYMTSLPSGASSNTVVNPSAGRISFTVTVGATAGNGTLRIGIGTATGTGVSADASVRFSHVQVETGSGASSYIPTGASQGTRNRDELTLTNLSSIAFSQTSGTAFAHVEVREKATGTFAPYGSFDTSGGGKCWWWLRHNRDASLGTRLLGTVFNSGGSAAITTSNYQYNSGNGGLVKFATSLDTAASALVYVIGGGSPQTTTASAFTLATAARWSVNVNNDVLATDLGSMWMRSFKYWPTRLPNAQLQSLTT
jgi:hypothetical protein